MNRLNFNFCLIFLLLKCILAIDLASRDKECSLLSTKHFGYTFTFHGYLNNTILLKNFNSYAELNFNCTRETKLKVKTLFIIPNIELLFDNSLDMSQLLRPLIFIESKYIFFFRSKGFNHILPGRLVNPYLSAFYVFFQYSRFDFYLNGSLITKSMCHESNFNKDTNFFGSMQNLNINYNTRFSVETCPYVFLNANLQILNLNQFANSFINKNHLEFIDINPENKSKPIDLNNSNMGLVYMDFAYYDLTLKLMNVHVFKHVKFIYISGILTNISNDLFSHFAQIKKINLNLNNLRQLLYANTKWLTSINSRVRANNMSPNVLHRRISSDVLLELVQVDLTAEYFNNLYSAYTYPDEDFCLFKDFPHANSVYPSLISAVKLECTCTILWLIQYANLYLETGTNKFKNGFYYDSYYDNDINHTVRFCIGQDFEARLKACNFGDRLSKCNTSSFKIGSILPTSLQINNEIDVYYLIKWLELVVLIFLEPIFCALGILFNVLVILVLRNERDMHKMKDNMYKHVLVNSYFNLAFCGITLLKLVNVCIFEMGEYCSSVYQTAASQYFKIVVVYFGGNVLKLCCNFSYISFAFSRFLLSANKTTGLYKKFDELNLIKYYIIVFVVSVLFSIFKLFGFQINEIYNSYKSFPFEIYDVGNCDVDYVYCVLFRTLKLVNDFIKNILIFFLNLFIDIYLMKFARQHLRSKKNLITDKSKISQAVKSINKINRMIIFNGFIFFVAYFPEFITNILLFTFDGYIKMFCLNYISCSDLNELAQFFNFISITFQFFVFKKFDKNFNDSFRNLKGKFLKKFSNHIKPKRFYNSY